MQISVALCTYDGARYLPKQLSSMTDQKRLPDELVVFDDGSADGTRELLTRFAKTAPFMVRLHFNTKNIGSTKNFEQAIQTCEGDIIVLSDQDDYWYENKLEVLEQSLAESPDAGLVFSDADVVDEAGIPLGYALWQSVRFTAREQQRLTYGNAFSVLLQHPIVTGATVAFRSFYRDSILPIPADWIHDEWIAILLAMQTSIRCVPYSLMAYRNHSGNQVGSEQLGMVNRLRVALSTDPEVYLSRAAQYRVLKKHIIQSNQNSPYIAALDGKIAHMQARGGYPDPRLLRIPGILREMFSRRYNRYSASILNAIRDLLLRHST